MEKLFTTELNKYNLKYVKIENENSLEKIYNLFKSNIFEEPSTDVEFFYYGVYYQYIEKNYDLMKKYYLMGIELNDSNSMVNLVFYYQHIEKNYQHIEKNYELMKKYYLMAIELNNSNAMFNLAWYYQHIEKNYDLIKKYYLMAIELNNSNAMTNLAFYYEITEKNYDLMKKYYLMAIELNHSSAMNNLARYYQYTEKNDQSFVELYKYEDKFINLFNDKFKNNINLDQKYYYSFLKWKSEEISDIVKIKQYILRKTNIFPKNYDKKYLIHFMEIISLKNIKLPKDILNLIAGHLFI